MQMSITRSSPYLVHNVHNTYQMRILRCLCFSQRYLEFLAFDLTCICSKGSITSPNTVQISLSLSGTVRKNFAKVFLNQKLNLK